MTLSKSLKNTAFGLLVTLSFALPMIALGQVTGGPEGGERLIDLITTIFNWFAALLFVIAAIFIVIAAFGYLTAGGDEEKVGKAKRQLVYSVIALVVGALAFFVPGIIQDILGIQVETVSPN
jgi:hypothetical protein